MILLLYLNQNKQQLTWKQNHIDKGKVSRINKWDKNIIIHSPTFEDIFFIYAIVKAPLDLLNKKHYVYRS